MGAAFQQRRDTSIPGRDLKYRRLHGRYAFGELPGVGPRGHNDPKQLGSTCSPTYFEALLIASCLARVSRYSMASVGKQNVSAKSCFTIQ